MSCVLFENCFIIELFSLVTASLKQILTLQHSINQPSILWILRRVASEYS